MAPAKRENLCVVNFARALVFWGRWSAAQHKCGGHITEEGERGTIRLRMVSPIWSVVAEIDEARLVGMECESIPCKSLTQNAEDPLGIEGILERHYGIVSESNKRTSPLETWPHF